LLVCASSHRCLPVLVAVACAAGCATGAESGVDDAASFGPGGPASPTDVTVTGGTADTTDGAGSVSNTGNATNSGDSADTTPLPECDGDDDGDGFGPACPAGEDCDDDDPEVNPGAAESCNGVDDNCDGMIDNGCECPDDGVSGSCNMPTDLGIIAMGETKLGVVGNAPTEDSIDWYVVHYPAVARPGEGTPAIQFSVNQGDAFVFDVVAGQCEASGASCTSGGTGGAAIGLTSWSFTDDDPGCCTPPADSMVAWPNDLYLRVYRTSPGSSCAAYQLQISR